MPMSGSNPVTSGIAVAALDDDAPQRRGGRFKPGNPGRPKGARHKTTLAIEALLDGEAEALTRKAIELAKAGDLVALRRLDRICPPRKERPVSFAMPEMSTAADAKLAASALVQPVPDGELTPGEASELGRLLDAFTRVLDAAEFEERISRLEAKDEAMRRESRLRKLEQTSSAVLGREVVFPGLSQEDAEREARAMVERGLGVRACPLGKISIRQLPCTTAEYCLARRASGKVNC